ncbi:MAG: methylenetetrahydrofolate reductase [NAD(P)H] [Gammaproteobacteria bacterium]|nr:MAG: methylenetetrahydrofolate reductase [NAD(P)H] [Gammaproteobacteria bacterium]
MESQKRFSPTFSCEFFPPRTPEGRERLATVLGELGALRPAYFSVTFGAGGSTREGTFETVLAIREAGFEAAPHLSCIGATRESLRAILHRYRESGIRRIVALRGDMPSGMHEPGEFRHANELVAFIREETGDHFHIEVAAYPEFHPQATDALADIRHFMNKVRAGANGAITQYFYNVDAYVRFIEACEGLGLDVPVVPGIMPITNYHRLARFSEACGAEIPRWLRKRLEAFGDDEASLRAFGVDVVTALCERLLAEGAPGLHFYTMNRTEPTRTLWRNLGLEGLEVRREA